MQPRPLECTVSPNARPCCDHSREQRPSSGAPLSASPAWPQPSHNCLHTRIMHPVQPRGSRRLLGWIEVGVVLGLGYPNGPSILEPGGFLTHGATWSSLGHPCSPRAGAGSPAGPSHAPGCGDAPSMCCSCPEGDVLDLLAEMLHGVTRVPLDVPERRLAWKPLPQTLICRVEVSIWRRGFFLSA